MIAWLCIVVLWFTDGSVAAKTVPFLSQDACGVELSRELANPPTDLGTVVAHYGVCAPVRGLAAREAGEK